MLRNEGSSNSQSKLRTRVMWNERKCWYMLPWSVLVCDTAKTRATKLQSQRSTTTPFPTSIDSRAYFFLSFFSSVASDSTDIDHEKVDEGAIVVDKGRTGSDKVTANQIVERRRAKDALLDGIGDKIEKKRLLIQGRKQMQ